MGKHYLKKYAVPLMVVIIILFIFLLAGVAYNFFDEKHHEEILLIGSLATTALFLGAYYQLHHVNKMQQTELFFNLASQFKDPNIVNARRIIHKLFIECYRTENPFDLEGSEKLRRAYYPVALQAMSHKILEMSKSNKPQDIEAFTYLLTWLEFLEMLGYFYTSKIASEEHIKTLFPDTIKFQYVIFSEYLESKGGKRFTCFRTMFQELGNAHDPY